MIDHDQGQVGRRPQLPVYSGETELADTIRIQEAILQQARIGLHLMR